MERGSLGNKLFIIFFVLIFLISTVIHFVRPDKFDESRIVNLAEADFFYQITEEDKSGLTVDFVNVGQGDCAFISCGGKNMLIDSGEEEYYQIIRGFLKKRGVTHFDYVLLSHPHSDHGGGMEKIIENYSVGTFLLPTVNEEDNELSDFYEKMILSAERHNVDMETVTAGDTYRLSDAEIEILGPVKNSSDENEMSVVCMLRYGDKKFLFTSDAPAEEELELISCGADIDCDVLKVSHHGSKDATCEEFLDRASPHIAVISVAEFNEYRHPDSKTIKNLLKRNVAIYRTDRDGTVSFRVPDINSKIIVG